MRIWSAALPCVLAASCGHARLTPEEVAAYIQKRGLCTPGHGSPAAPENGSLPPEVIQHIVRQRYAKFRDCYEEGLRRNGKLQGRVAVRFVIERDGTVEKVSSAGSDLPDPAVVQCTIEEYEVLGFPPPEGTGIITVV